jgi:hypothetical protein
MLNVVIFAVAPKLSCEHGDPFGETPVDSFIPPENAKDDDIKKWRLATAKMISDISR